MHNLGLTQLPSAPTLRVNGHGRKSYLNRVPPRRVKWDFDGCVTRRSDEVLTIQQILWPKTLGVVDARFIPGHAVFTDLNSCLKVPGAWPEHFESVSHMLDEKHGRKITPANLRRTMMDSIRWFGAEFESLLPQGITPSDGVPELIERWSGSGADMGIVTSGLQAYSAILLPKLRLQSAFNPNHIVCVETVEAERELRPALRFKPYPDPWLLCLERMGAEKNQHIVLIEDNPKNGFIALNELLWEGYADVTLIIVTRDGKTFDQTTEVLDKVCRDEIEAHRSANGKPKLTKWGLRADIFYHIIVVETFRELLAA